MRLQFLPKFRFAPVFAQNIRKKLINNEPKKMKRIVELFKNELEEGNAIRNKPKKIW